MVSKIVQVFLFPPGLFLLLIAAGLFLFFLTTKRRLGKVFLIVSAVLIYFCSVTPIKNLLLLPLEDAYPALSPAAIDTRGDLSDIPIVVLGGGTVALSPDEGYRSSLSPDALKRLIYGIRLRSRFGGPIVVTGGSVYNYIGAEPEAAAAKNIAVDLGISADAVITETESRNTWENGYYTKQLLPGESAVILVTSAYHMKRSVKCFEAQGLTVIPAPTDYKIDRTVYQFIDYLPSLAALRGTAAALREYWGLLYYGIRYY